MRVSSAVVTAQKLAGPEWRETQLRLASERRRMQLEELEPDLVGDGRQPLAHLAEDAEPAARRIRIRDRQPGILVSNSKRRVRRTGTTLIGPGHGRAREPARARGRCALRRSPQSLADAARRDPGARAGGGARRERRPPRPEAGGQPGSPPGTRGPARGDQRRGPPRLPARRRRCDDRSRGAARGQRRAAHRARAGVPLDRAAGGARAGEAEAGAAGVASDGS
jgi:hypothetical protein